MSLLDATEEASRRAAMAASPDLHALATRLNTQLDPLRERDLVVPTVKAALTPRGGVCSRDGTRLHFDPRQPDDHVCPMCGGVERGDLHHRAWVWRYHLWLSERAIHFAALYRLGYANDGSAWAERILQEYARRYRDFPNRDNVLGPTRLFFSTYLESIWLLQLTIAARLLDDGEAGVGHRDELEDMVAESAELIGSFDEGFSNRQVWNNTALISAGLFLEDDQLVERAVGGAHGIVAALEGAVAPNGRWAEGENYHFFALRGFQLAAELLRGPGYDLYRDEHTERLAPMYTAPLMTLMPDLTFPARGDSPYGVSIRQPRFAELWEVARARVDGEPFDELLAGLYEGDPGPDPGFEEIAEVEVHRPPSGLRRDRLGWRGLLWMRDTAPRAAGAPSFPSVVVEPLGPAILRGPPNRYVGLETGTGAGHGHPDALHLTLFDGAPVLTDPGTASYVSSSLHWYRSTLAHNAPVLARVGQRVSRGWCSAFETDESVAWAQAQVNGFAGPSTVARRSVVMGRDFVVDVVDLDVPDHVTVDLPLHVRGEWSVDGAVVDLEPGDVATSEGLETGYEAVEWRGRGALPRPQVDGRTGDREWSVFLAPRPNETVFLVRAPAPPSLAFADGPPAPGLLRRCAGRGRWVMVYSPGRMVTEVTVEEDVVQITTEGDRVQVEVDADGAVIRSDGSDARLTGIRPVPTTPAVGRTPVAHLWCPLLGRAPRLDQSLETLPWNAIHPLGEQNYRRSELAYPGADAFSARFGVWVTGPRLYFAVDVKKTELTWWDPVAAPELDNETSAIHADGVQFHWAMPDGAWRGCLALPQGDGTIRVEAMRGQPDVHDVEATWMTIAGGYRVMGSCEHDRRLGPGDRLRVNLVVNEMRPGRLRRAGQLVFAGGGGWVYLRGDREPAHTAAVADVR